MKWLNIFYKVSRSTRIIMQKKTRPVVSVDSTKCINCHRCIAVCPSKMCNDASGDYVKVNGDLCIGCGACIDTCTHGARVGLDDAAEFFEALKQKQKMVAIVAPSVAVSFPGTN